MNPIIEIKKPCHEVLDNQKAGEPGKYCKSCQTLVIDFTCMTPEEISQYFSNHGVTCGIFNRKDVNTGSATDRLIRYLEKRKLKFLASLIVAVMILSGCRTRYMGAPGVYSDSIRNLGDTTATAKSITKPD